MPPAPAARDESHFDRLLQLLGLEREEERRRFAEMRATLTPVERAQRGFALLDLEAVDESFGLGGRILVDLERGDRSALEARVGNGDLVELRPRKAEVDEAFTGVVARRTRTRVTVAFDRPPPPWVTDGRLIVDLTSNDVTFERSRAAVQKVRGLDRGAERRKREVLLGREHPRFAKPQALEGEDVRGLNPEQRDAVERALAAEEFFLVHGPPGTGKSTVLGVVARRAVARRERVLATAPSNAAVDHLLELCLEEGLRVVRVGHPARVAERLQAHTLDALVEEHADRKIARELFDEAYELLGYARKQRTRGRSSTRFANAREAKDQARKMLDEAREREKRAVRAVLDRAQVVCATLTGAAGHELSSESFDLALFDEATQSSEPLGLVPFLRAGRVVLAGDHRQLGPTVLSPRALEGGLGKSLFERLLEDHGEGVKRMLREQYRMHESIMAFPSREMYGGELRAHPSVAGRTLADVRTGEGAAVALDAPPVLFLDTAGKGFEDVEAPGTESRVNPGEAGLVVARLRELLDAGVPPGEVAVIAPYSAQVALLRERAAAQGAPDAVEIDTVDAFQGREKDAVLVSLTRSNPEGEVGFLSELRRMNVAITRPRRHLFVVGDSATLATHAYYQRFVDHAQSLGGYRSAWEWPEPE